MTLLAVAGIVLGGVVIVIYVQERKHEASLLLQQGTQRDRYGRIGHRRTSRHVPRGVTAVIYHDHQLVIRIVLAQQSFQAVLERGIMAAQAKNDRHTRTPRVLQQRPRRSKSADVQGGEARMAGKDDAHQTR